MAQYLFILYLVITDRKFPFENNIVLSSLGFKEGNDSASSLSFY